MAYAYHDWEEQATDALRLARLRQHLTEVGQKIAADVADGGKSRSSASLISYRDQLREERNRLEAATNANAHRRGVQSMDLRR